MKIAIIADPLDNQTAGVHSYTKHLVSALIKHKDNHEIVVIREKKDPDLLGCQQIAIPNIKLPIGLASLRLFFVIPFILRREKVDVVIEPAHFGPFNLPAKMTRVTMIHDLTPFLFPQYHRWHSQWLQQTFLKTILKRTDIILSNSKNTSRDIETTFPFAKEKIKTIYLGKDEFYKPAINNSALSALGIQQPYFHFVGTIEPRKDLRTLLRAYTKFRQTNENKVQLVIAGGKGWKSDAFFKDYENHSFRDDIILTGYVDKSCLPVLHTYSIALIYPSIYEGFGLPILEALSCGGTVITAQNSSLTEVGGGLALYFATNNEQSLYEVMQMAVEFQVTDETRESRLSWAAQFSWDNYAIQLLQHLKSHRSSNVND